MIIWSSYVILILGLGAAVGLILLEIRLASFDKPWVGLLPLALLVAVAILSNLAVIMVYGGDEVKELTVDMRGGNTAQMYVRQNDRGEITAYSELKIFSPEGELIDEETITMMDLEDGGYLPDYAEMFRTMTKDKKILARWECEEAVLKDLRKIIVHRNGVMTTFNPNVIYLSILYLGVPMVLVYWMKRRQVQKKKTAAEMRKMGIKSL